MSIFKDSAIVIKIIKKENKEFIYHLMSEKFWKILAVKKLASKEKPIDIWYHINYEIESNKKDKISKLRMIKILNEFNYKNKKFSEIKLFLELIGVISKKVEFGVENLKINEIIKQIIKYEKDDLEIKLILAKLKIVDILWELDIKYRDKLTQRILIFINKNDFKNILKLSWINNRQKKQLQDIL